MKTHSTDIVHETHAWNQLFWMETEEVLKVIEEIWLTSKVIDGQ